MITPVEHGRRLAALQKAAARHELDAFLVSAEESIYYLTGVSYRPLERPFFILVRPEGAPSLLVPALEQEHLAGQPNIARVEAYWDYPSPPGQGWPERLRELLAGVTSLGVEPTLTQEVAAGLAAWAPPVLPLVENLRLVKSPPEVAMLRQAAHYADLAVAKVLAAAYYGVSELELFAQGRPVQLAIIRETAYEALTTQVLAAAWPAPLSAQPHGVPQVADCLREGPHIALGLLRVNGYAAECERTFFLAPPGPELQEAFGIMQEARRRALALVRPGVPAAAVDLAAKDFLTDEGFGNNLLHRTGHGFGLGNHEGPWVAEGSPDILAENMLISVEPGIYLPGVGGVRHSDTTLVTRDGFEHLTKEPTDLASLTLTGGKTLARLRGFVIRRAAGLA
ncbi:MAG: Xaa-Pro peptidase family protein [Deltaproteobacteria bacterium]|nr:Xaa-Pro peptidase family protein [Deltaproteobacteria bacterium]